MKLTTELMVILSSLIYLPDIRLLDGAVTKDCVPRPNAAAGTSPVKYTSSSMVPSQHPDLGSSTETISSSSSSSAEPSQPSDLGSSSMKPCQPSDPGSLSTVTISSISTLAEIPFGNDDFDNIRKYGKLFIDKTSYITELIREGQSKLLVLTRPKRLGKSVFLQMLHRFFEGKEELFRNTAIWSRGNRLTLNDSKPWTPFPVIFLDFDDLDVLGTFDEFKIDLHRKLRKAAKPYADKLPTSSTLNIGALINGLQETYRKPVVVLIDNYDLPLMRIVDSSIKEEITAYLAYFFAQIRSNQVDLRLAFVVGISKLNMLSNGQARFLDLTFTEKFSSIMGFTSEEVGKHLRPYIEKFSEDAEKVEDDIKFWYGGYQFPKGNDLNHTLNSASVCECIRERCRVTNYMGNTELVSIIKKRLKEINKTIDDFENLKLDVSEMDRCNLEDKEISLALYLLCNGYLTMKNLNEKTMQVSLRIPNEEIRTNLRSKLANLKFGTDGIGNTKLQQALIKNDIDEFVYLVNQYLFRRFLTHTVNIGMSEFLVTRHMFIVLDKAHILFKEGELLWGNDEENKGDLDIRMMTDDTDFIVGMKYGESALTSLIALLPYVVFDDKEDALRSKIRPDKKYFFVAMNVIPRSKVKDKVTAAAINEWVIVPYKDGHLFLNETQTSANIAATFDNNLNHRVQHNWPVYNASSKLIWPPNRRIFKKT